jgi:hypothetical protein
MKRIIQSIYNWRELWFWPLIALLQWYLLIELAFAWTGRAPQESMDFLMGLGANIVVCVFSISLVSVLRESTGQWWTKDDLRDHPHLAWAGGIIKAIALIAFLWALKR